ncbi:MAG TPA: hypothetical protein PLW31_12985 [Bacteroidales bacterium]|nr:hypothetical protein [Bacteroidales bacterium]HPI87286.1 hypothetical protein [Bacteroidales bacterium]HPM93513.1 hypothetical protein [Bacteroidales bacterium]
MKKIINPILLLSFSFICSLPIQASINIVGNDTIHYDNEKYFIIYQTDTFYVDTSLIFIRYNGIANTINIESIENEYDLNLNHYFTFGWHSYTYDPGYRFVELATDLSGENLVEAVEYNTSVYPACEPLEAADNYSLDQWY